MKQQTQVSTSSIITLQVSPAQVMRGKGAVSQAGANIAQFGNRPLIIGGEQTLTLIQPHLEPILEAYKLSATTASYLPDSCDQSHKYLQNVVADHKADFIIGIGGGQSPGYGKMSCLTIEFTHYYNSHFGCYLCCLDSPV